jgi:hypothetical protein
VELVAVGGDDEPVTGMGPPRDEDEAHYGFRRY